MSKFRLTAALCKAARCSALDPDTVPVIAAYR